MVSFSVVGNRVFDGINNLYEWGTWESRVFTQCGGGFETSFREHVKKISLTNLPSHRRRDRKSQITPLYFESLMASCFVWLCNVCHRCWRLCRCQRDKHKVDSWSSVPSQSCGKAKNQTCVSYLDIRVVWNVWLDRHLQQKARAAADGNDEAFPHTVVPEKRSSVCAAGFAKDKSCLEALALKHSLVECGTMIRWCYPAAQLGDVVTKASDTARAPRELFVRRGFRWELIHDPKFESSRNRAVQNVDLAC